MNEDELVALVRERLREVENGRVLVGIGDDAAVWQPKRNNRSVITSDVLVEGVHFTRAAMTPEQIGHRALAVNLSDIAAMGARPVLATVALGLARDTDPAWVLACYDGIAALAKRTRCAIAGGDLSRAPAAFFALTLVGEVRASNLRLRSGARPGDVVAVTGALGASRAGLCVAVERPELAADPAFAALLSAFRTPEPRLREGRWLAASRHVRALMDLSDGLSSDLARLCAASQVGATIEAIPLEPAARLLAERVGEDPESWALDGGEDFELLVAIDRRAFAHMGMRFKAHTGRELLRVGTITEGTGVRRADGAAVAASGWDHLR